MKLHDVRIATQLRLALGVILALVVGLGGFAWHQTRLLWTHTQMLYNHPFQVNSVITQAVDEELPPLHSDPDKCHHILQNLVGNALKFTEHGTVEVSARHANGELEVAVRDTGIGITTGQIPHIFDEFRQTDDSTPRKYGGTGLGLAIAKRYAQRLGGDITVQSTPGVGSTFTLRLPLVPTPAEADPSDDSGPAWEAAAPGPATPGTSHLRMEPPVRRRPLDPGQALILIVEDNADNLHTARALLDEHYPVICAEDGQSAIAQARLHQPALILTDLALPVMDGYAALAAIRQDPALCDIPVIAVTASAMKGNREEILARGFDGYISKPIDHDTLLQTLHQFLG